MYWMAYKKSSVASSRYRTKRFLQFFGFAHNFNQDVCGFKPGIGISTKLF